MLLIGLGWASSAGAQNTAVIFGEVVDVSKDNTPVADAVVVVSSLKLQGDQTTLSDERGQYRIDQLPPGDYSVKVVAPGFKEFNVTDVHLLVGRQIKVPVGLLPEMLTGETIQVERQITSTIDQASAAAGLTVTKDYIDRVTTKRSFEAVSEATPGAQTDFYGVSFGGTTSPENNTLIDGVNVSSPGFGINNLVLPPEFFDQIDIKTGGYMPEFGQATGGFVDSVTKIGGNEIHGSVFSYTTPLRLPRLTVARSGEAIVGRDQLNIRQELGFEVGGPIIKDKLWFHVGFAPRYQQLSFVKTFQRQVADDSGSPLIDRASGVPQTEAIPGIQRRYPQHLHMYAFTGKLTWNIDDNHRISLGGQGNPNWSQGFHPDFGAGAGLNGDTSSFIMGRREGVYNGTLAYDGKALENRLLLSARIAYSQTDRLDLVPGASSGVSITRLDTMNIIDADQDPALVAACSDTFADGSTRCPVSNYSIGGVGFNEYRRSERWTARGTVAYLLNLLGTHTLKAGFEWQRMQNYNRARYTTGVAMYDYGPDEGIYLDIRRFGRVLDPNADPADEGAVEYQAFRVGQNHSHNWIGFLQDSWNIDRINVNIAGGVRLDWQELFGPSSDPSAPPGMQQRYINLQNWAPRFGVTWDPLGNGRSKIFGSYGRFYQLVPLQIATRNFPVEQQIVSIRERCGYEDPGACPALERIPVGGDATTVFQPLRGQFVDTFTAGAEYQILADLLAGINYINSRYGDVIEDFSTDDGAHYYIGNPGQGEAINVEAPDPVTGVLRPVRFPKPERRYDAINLYVTKSLRNNFIVQASYTLSFLRGHYAGLYRPEDTQLDPNMNSDLDLVDLLANRYGALPADRTHQFKLDGAYIIDVSERFALVPNMILRVGSGTPYSYTGPHVSYGPEQSFIIARGLAGRTDPLFQVDAGLNAEYAFDKSTRLSLGLTLINVGSAQLSTTVDQRYVRDNQNVTPIEGGDKGDLRFVKTNDNQPVVLNQNFGNATVRQLPMELRINAKLTF